MCTYEASSEDWVLENFTAVLTSVALGSSPTKISIPELMGVRVIVTTILGVWNFDSIL